MMAASAFEYRHRYPLHGLVYLLCLAAPWTPFLPVPFRAPLWSFVQNGSCWFLLANEATRPLYRHFADVWDAVLLLMIMLAGAGAGLRVWGAAYLGAMTVQRGGMVSDAMVVDGPFRWVRNPLYLGTVLHTAALAFIMRPEAAVLCSVLIMWMQFRLIGREEPFLLERFGEQYRVYMTRVPRFVPALTPRVPPGGHRAHWGQGLLSELYVTGVALTLLLAGWSRGFGWEASIIRVMQGVIVSLGISVAARAFIPKAAY